MNPETFLERFSDHLKNVIARAISLTASLGHDEVSPAHVLMALAEEHGSIAAEILYRFKIKPKNILQNLEEPNMIKIKDKKGGAVTVALPELNRQTKEALEKAMLTAYERTHNYIGTEHFLLGLISKPDKQILDILAAGNVRPADILNEIETVLQSTSKFPDIEDVKDAMEQIQDIIEQQPQQFPNRLQPNTNSFRAGKNKKQNQSAIYFFSTNLTDKHRAKTSDPVIGREKEIERVINVLSRRNKNNPVLIGEPGVGKTAIVEGLAKRIAEGQVPEILKRKIILSLDLTLLIAGTIYRGEFESRLKQIIDEAAKNPNYILFIDELHNIIGAGSNSGTMDAANILKPALARGQLHCIGATTIDEYKKHISSDPALERRFQSIEIREPSAEETVQILKGIKNYYEDFHGTRITDEAIENAVELSSRYIHDNFLPDKAIDLIDEASAAVRAKRKHTKAEKEYIKLEQQLEDCREKKSKAIRDEEFDNAIILKNREESLKKTLKLAANKRKKSQKTTRKKVTKEDIANILHAKLNIPLDCLLSSEWDILDKLPSALKNHIIGQDRVINQLARALKHSHLRLSNQKKPFGSFIFAGPSGVGKTALAKILAKELYHDEKTLLRLDMSEFSEAHGISKLLGSPAGYVGYKERNRFMEDLRKRPHAVVLFDEFDKAHIGVQKLLLQILDEGELTDSQGKKTSFEHSIIILTTNIGAELYKSSGIGFGQEKNTKSLNKETENAIISKLKEEFGEALINRIQATCIFSPLEPGHIEKIVKKNIKDLSRRLALSKQFSITPDKKVITSIAKQAYAEDTGARNVDTVIQQILHNLILAKLKNAKRKKEYILTKKNKAYTLL